MAKIYQITAANGKPKESWEEIICDFIAVNNDGVITFYDDSNIVLVVYKLAEGEALIYVGEE